MNSEATSMEVKSINYDTRFNKRCCSEYSIIHCNPDDSQLIDVSFWLGTTTANYPMEMDLNKLSKIKDS